MSTIHIRPATAADLPVLLSYEQDLVATERPFDPTLAPGKIHYYNLPLMLEQPTVCLVVAAEGDTVVGCGYGRIEPAKAYLAHANHCYLGFMYVQPSHRGRGINQLVMDYLSNWANKKGITELRLDVFSLNNSAIRAYEKAGFIQHMILMRKGIS